MGPLILTTPAASTSSAVSVSRVQFGSGFAIGTDIVPAFVGLKVPQANGTITGVNALIAGQVSVRANLSSAGLSSPFFLNEIGIFGHIAAGPEQLLAYGSTGSNTGDLITPGSQPSVKDFSFLLVFPQPISASGVVQSVQIVAAHEANHLNNGIDAIPITTSVHSGLAPASPGDGLQTLISTSPVTWFPTLLVISANSTLYVTTTGSDSTGVIGNASFPFATINGALSKLQNYVLLFGITVTISVAAGIYTSSAPITVNHPNASQIQITGSGPLVTSVSGNGTITGSAGAWAIPLTVASSTGISVGDYLMVAASAGSQDFQWFSGIFKVTNVSGSVVTVTGTQRLLRYSGSTITAGTAKVCKTRLAFTGCDGFDITNCSLGLLDKISISGDLTSGKNGINIPVGAPQVTVGLIGISSFDTGVYLIGSGGNLNGSTVYSSGNATAGVSANFGAAVNLSTAMCTGNGSFGAYAQGGATISFGVDSTFSNNGNGIYVSQATASANNANVTGNSISGIVSLNGAIVAADFANSCVNVTADYYALGGAYVTASFHQIYAGTGVICSLAANTVGGAKSFINFS